MTLKDHYKTLGIATSASKAEVVSSFRQLAKKWHPDVSKLPNATENFRNIYEAYEILSDTKKKFIYDGLIAAQSRLQQVPISKPQDQGDYPTYKHGNTHQKYQTWEREAQVKADYYSRVSFNIFTKKIKYAFTPKLRLNGKFENLVLPHLFLFAFAPLGLYAAWISTLPKWYKFIISIPFTIFCLLIIFLWSSAIIESILK